MKSKTAMTSALTWALLAASCEYTYALESKTAVDLKAEAATKVEVNAESKVESLNKN